MIWGRSTKDSKVELDDEGQVIPPTRKSTKRKSKTFYKTQCASIVAIGNLGISFTSPEDVLDDDEMDLLTDALTAECMASNRIANWLERTAAVSPHLLLIKAVVQISYPRLQRRGLIPSTSNEEIHEDLGERVRKYWNSQGIDLSTLTENIDEMTGAINENAV